MSWLIDAIRRLRSRRVAALGLALLVGVTAFAAAAGPRLFARVSRESVVSSIAAIPAGDRIINLSQTDNLETGSPTYPDLAAVDTKGEGLAASLPTPLPDVVGSPTAVVETPSDQTVSGTSALAEIRLRVMEHADEHIRLVDGRAPTDAVTSVPDPLHSTEVDEIPRTIPQYEAEISAAAADKLGIKAGSSIVVDANPQLDPLSGGGAIGILISGTFEPTSPTDPYWLDDTKVIAFGLRDLGANTTYVQSTLLMAPSAYTELATGRTVQGELSGGLTIAAPALRISWRFAADPSRIGPEQLGPTIVALRRLQTLYPALARHPRDISMTTSLLRSLVGLQGPWDAAGGLLAVAAIGAAAVALASLALVVALTAEDRRRVLLIQRERGASAAQSILSSLLEALIVVLPPGILGTAIAVSVVPAGDDGTSILLGAVVVLAALAFSLGVILGAILGPPRLPTRARTIVRAVRVRRLVFDGVIVGVAIAAAAAVRQRGLQGAGGPTVSSATGVVDPTALTGNTTTDPLLAAAPLLVGVAAAVIAIRVAPLPLAGLAWLAARLRGLAPVLAARRSARDAGAARVLLIVLAIATLGGFASATVVELQGTADLQSWQDVGAPFRLDAALDPRSASASFPGDFDASALPGVTTAIRAHLAPYSISTGGQRELVALDLAAYQRMVAGTPVAVDLPPALLAAPAAVPAAPPGSAGGTSGPGSEADPLAAIVSSGSSGPFAAPKVGDVFQLSLSTKSVSFRVAAVMDRWASMPAGQPFVVASWPQIEAAAPNRVTSTTNVYLAAVPGSGAAIAAAAKAVDPEAVVSDRETVASALAEQGVVRVVSIGVDALAGIALLYAALAVVSAFVLTASSRADEAAHLATLGLSDRQSWSMLVVEFGPPAVLAVLAGAALGLGLFAFLAPGLGLTTIVGALQSAPPGLDASQVGLLALLIGGILALGVALAAPAQRRAAWASVRRGLR